MGKINSNMATMVVKPDAMNEQDFNYVLKMIKSQNVLIEDIYKIKDFENTMKHYRYADLIFKSPNVQQKDAPLCSVALTAYSMLYPNRCGALIVIKKKEDDERDLFVILKEVKKTIRETFKKRDPNIVLLKNNDEKIELRKVHYQEFRAFQQEHKGWIAARINGVHLEDRMCFKKNFCYEFMKKEGVVCNLNKIKKEKLELGL